MNTLPESPPPGYEARDVRVRVVVATVVLVSVGLAACLGVAAWISQSGRPTHRPAGPEMAFQHGAGEATSIARDWRAQDAAVREHLEKYAWVDRPAGIVRIPVERAMALTVSETTAPPSSR